MSLNCATGDGQALGGKPGGDCAGGGFFSEEFTSDLGLERLKINWRSHQKSTANVCRKATDQARCLGVEVVCGGAWKFDFASEKLALAVWC